MFFCSHKNPEITKQQQSQCAVDGATCLWMAGPCETVSPWIFPARTGPSLSHLFVWSGDTLKAQQDLSVELRIIRRRFCSAACASLPSTPTVTEDRSSRLKYVTFKSHHVSCHPATHTCASDEPSWLNLWKLSHILTFYRRMCRETETAGVSLHAYISFVSLYLKLMLRDQVQKRLRKRIFFDLQRYAF